MNRLTITIKLNILILISMFSLAGCSLGGDGMSELEQYVDTAINRDPGPIEPLPVFTDYAAFTYSAAGLRGPFDIPIEVSQSGRNPNLGIVQPDESRQKEHLESFALGTLRMVGSMSRSNQTWALIIDEENAVNRVTTGNYLGKNHGRIVSTEQTQINIVEIVPNGSGGWTERPQIITLAE